MDYVSGATVDIWFNTVDSAGDPITLAGTPAACVLVGNSTSEVTTGVTLNVDHSDTGTHHVRIVTTDAAYTDGSDVAVKLSAGTVDGVSVAGAIVGTFSIGRTNVASIATAVAQKIAHIMLRRTMTNVEASSDGDTVNISSLYGLIQQMQESNTTANANKVTVYKVDGSTELAQRTITTSGSADLITGIS